eukprot:scaffold731_cov261-Pinguiococcus_pyrenoidosus.AAC.38
MQRALSDLEGRIGMVTEILDIKEFVSGQQYHRNKAFMKRIKDGKDIPWVMHYCWTLSKVRGRGGRDLCNCSLADLSDEASCAGREAGVHAPHGPLVHLTGL